MSLEHILLGLLREPATGYDLKRTFDESIRHFWSAELSQIYPTLQRMEGRAWLTSRREPSLRGPQRRVYTRTDAGVVELRSWLLQGPVMGTERFAYLGQLFFMAELGDLDRTEAFASSLRSLLVSWRGELEAIETGWAAQVPGFPDTLDDAGFHAHLCVRMGIRTIGAKADWCDEVLARVRARTKKKRTGAEQ